MGLYAYFAKAIDFDSGCYGLALLAGYPLPDAQTIRLPVDASLKGEAGVLAVAGVEPSPVKRRRTGCPHLDQQNSPASRLLQMARISNHAVGETVPFVVAGHEVIPET